MTHWPPTPCRSPNVRCASTGSAPRASQRATDRARLVLPLGVPSSFQAYDPHPIVVRRAQARWMEDVDGNRYTDYDMGFGALFAGHCHPLVRRSDRSASSTTARCSSRRARATPMSPSCSVLATACRCGASRTAAPKRRWTPSASPGASPAGQDRQGRRRLPRASRRSDGLDEAAARQGRPGRQPDAGAAPALASPTAVFADTHRHPVQRRRGARSGAARPATSPASSSSR